MLSAFQKEQFFALVVMGRVATLSTVIFSYLAGFAAVRYDLHEAMRTIEAAVSSQGDAHQPGRYHETHSAARTQLAREKNATSVDGIGELLSKVMNLLKGFVDLTPLKIELADFTCVQHEVTTSELVPGKVLKYNGIYVSCNTHKIRVGQPAHWHEDDAFVSDTLIEVDNIGLSLQCDPGVFGKYLQFVAAGQAKGLLHKVGLGGLFGAEKHDAAWSGAPLCDIKKLEIVNPKIYLETLGPNMLKRTKSNVQRFQEEASELFQKPDGEEEEQQEEGNPLITFRSIQDGRCLENVYGPLAKLYEGLCGFVLLKIEVNVDGIKLTWKQEYTKLLAKLLSVIKKFTLAKILGYIVTHAGYIATRGAGAVNAIRRQFRAFDDMFVTSGEKNANWTDNLDLVSFG